MLWLTAPVQNWRYVISQDINVVLPRYHIVFSWFEVLKEVFFLLSTMMSRKETRVRRRVSLDVIAHFQFSWLWSAFACFAPPTSKHKLSFSVFKIFYQGSLSYGTFCISGNYGTSWPWVSYHLWLWNMIFIFCLCAGTCPGIYYCQ